MITYQPEPWVTFRAEAQSLFRSHWEEIGVHRDIMPLDPDYDRYNELDRQGALLVVTARSGEKMVGYIMYLFSKSLHYKGWMNGHVDIVYVAPEYRRGGAGLKLMQIGDHTARLHFNGKLAITHHVKPDHDFSRLLTRMGYGVLETLYMRIM